MKSPQSDNVGQSLGLPDFVDPQDLQDESFEASQTWGEERPATPVVNDPGVAHGARSRGSGFSRGTNSASRADSGARGSRGEGWAGKKRQTGSNAGWGSSTAGPRSGGKKRKKPLTWQEKQERKEKRAAKRAEADAKERERDPLGHAREIVLTQLTAAPKSRAQLEKKLADREVEPDVAEAVLDRMEDVGLVNDSELAGMIVRSQVAGRGLARRALRQELQKKGITAAQAEEALEQVTDDSERQRARELVDKKLRTMSRLDDDTKKRRLLGLLGRKGYPGSLAWSVILEALESQ